MQSWAFSISFSLHFTGPCKVPHSFIYCVISYSFTTFIKVKNVYSCIRRFEVHSQRVSKRVDVAPDLTEVAAPEAEAIMKENASINANPETEAGCCGEGVTAD